MENKIPKRILINAVSSKMGGALTYLKNLITELQLIDNQNVYIICVSAQLGDILSDRIKDQNIKIIHVPNIENPILRLWWDQVGIISLIKEERIDILFSIANFATLLCPCKQLLLIRGYLMPMPYFKEIVFSKYSLKKKIVFYLKQGLICLSAKKSDVVMFPTQGAANDFLKMFFIPKEKMVVNHYGTYLDKFKNDNPHSGNEKGAYRLLYSTMYTERKNFSTVFKALNILKKEGIPFQFITPGDMEDSLAKATATAREDRHLIEEFGLKDSIVFTGKLTYEKIDTLYKNADIFLWPTLIESFGHPLIEAMAAGLPIIASDIPVNRELGGDTMLYFDPFDYIKLADSIKSLISDANLKSTMSLRSLQRSKDFAWASHVEKLVSIFNSL